MAGASRKIEMDKKVRFSALESRTRTDSSVQVIQAGRYDNKSTAEERDEYLVRHLLPNLRTSP